MAKIRQPNNQTGFQFEFDVTSDNVGGDDDARRNPASGEVSNGHSGGIDEKPEQQNLNSEPMDIGLAAESRPTDRARDLFGSVVEAGRSGKRGVGGSGLARAGKLAPVGDQRTGRTRSRTPRAVGTTGADPATAVTSNSPQLDLFTPPAPARPQESAGISREFVERFGKLKWDNAREISRFLSEELPSRLVQDRAYKNAMANSGRQNAEIEHGSALNRVMLGVLDEHIDLFLAFCDNADFRGWLTERMFQTTAPALALPPPVAERWPTAASRQLEFASGLDAPAIREAAQTSLWTARAEEIAGLSAQLALAGEDLTAAKPRLAAASTPEQPAGTEGGQAALAVASEAQIGADGSQAHVSGGAVAAEPPQEDFDLSGEDIGRGGLGKKYRNNVRAIRILKAMDAESRKATPDERRAIAHYVGWGALKGVFDPDNAQWSREHAELRALLDDGEWRAARASILNAHYTSPAVAAAMFEALDRAGFRSGRVLEPSVGVGNFFGMMPADMRKGSELHGVELDPITAKIAAALYPSANVVNKGFQDFDIPSEYFDVAIGNPPFGSEPLVDMQRSAYSGFSIHNYFLAKSVDKLRPGGMMAMVVSRYFMDTKDIAARKWMAERARLVSAARLPNTAFKENAGTEVVTDILVFQKLAQGEKPETLPEWVMTGTINLPNTKTGEELSFSINSYFIEHPENVLGSHAATDTLYRANGYSVEPSGELAEQLAQWASFMPSCYTAIERAPHTLEADVCVPDGVKEGSYFVAEDGKIMMRAADHMGNRAAIPWDAPNSKAIERMRGMIGLRDALRDQMRMEMSHTASEVQIEAGRSMLSGQYDAFQQAFGYVHDPVNLRVFREDTEVSLVLALEFDYDRGVSDAVAKREEIAPRKPSANRADILMRRVLFPPNDDISVSTAKDALVASLNYRGRIDLDYMQSVYSGKDDEEIVAELGDMVFHDPIIGLVQADEYLSGDVKTKLAEAKAAALDNPVYQRNVEALERVIPADKRPSEINATLGTAFIPGEIFAEFAEHVTGVRPSMSYIAATGQWAISFPRHLPFDPALNFAKFGTNDMPAKDIFCSSIEGRGAVVTEVDLRCDPPRRFVKERETEAAREKQQAMKEEWKRWLWADPARADRVASLFNEKLNRIVPRKFDGSHLTLPGLSPIRELLPNQKNAAWRGLQSRQVLLDHVVGAGKTAAIIATMMEMRRMGMARKPLIAVPNHLTMQWQSEFYKFFPAARVMAATPEDFTKGNREKFFAKIITGDWDAVIVGHSSLKKIGLPHETEMRVLKEQVNELAHGIEMIKQARGDKHIVRDMERIKARLEAQVKDKMARVGTRDKAMTFDELGIDAFSIDEIHEFKNLYYNSTMDRVPGMGNPSGSEKSFDLFIKTQWLWETYKDKAILIGATGTPISNSMVEMFNLQRYLQYPTLREKGLHVFDAWARQFSNAQSVYEVSPSGTGYRQSSRLEFSGLNALMPLYNSFTDTLTLQHLIEQEQARGKTFPVPKILEGGPINVVAPRSPEVARFMGEPHLELTPGGQPMFEYNVLADRIKIEQSTERGITVWRAVTTNNDSDYHTLAHADTEDAVRLAVVQKALTPKIIVDEDSILGQFNNLRELMRETNGQINALSLTNQANKAGLDYRLINPSAPDFPESKINMAVDRMMSLYHGWEVDKGTQIVFCDLSVPLSTRSAMSKNEQQVYVRELETGAVVRRRGTLHTESGFDGMPFFIVKEKGAFSVYDAGSGAFILSSSTKDNAKEEAGKFLVNDVTHAEWMAMNLEFGAITDDEILEYNAENNIDIGLNETDAISRADITGFSAGGRFSVYDDIKSKLIARGVPEREIAFVHDANTPAAKAKLFKAVNRGDIRFLFGSTPKMGAGTNVQERLVGLHHIDAPWRPSDLEQREGRIVRQGNKLYQRDPEGFAVAIYRYATAQTYDTRRWQILEHKARMIEQIKNYDGSIGSVDDIGAETASAADMKAAASGDPMILEETRLRNEVKRLQLLETAHADEVVGMLHRAKQADTDVVRTTEKLRSLKEMLDVANQHPIVKDMFPGVTINNKYYSDREQAVSEIKKRIAAAFVYKSNATFTFRGVNFNLFAHDSYVSIETKAHALDSFPRSEAPPSASGFITRFANAINRMPLQIEQTALEIDKRKKDAVTLREQATKPFDKAHELDEGRRAYKIIQRQLVAKGPEIPAKERPILESAMERQKKMLLARGFGKALGEFLGDKSICVAQGRERKAADYSYSR